jgi:hypothetical protein
MAGWRTLRELNSLISEIFVSISEKIMQIFLLNAHVFRDFLIFGWNFQRIFLHCVLHPEWIPSKKETALPRTTISPFQDGK